MLHRQVYGETSYEFIDQIIRTVNFTEEDRFIDLGSGQLMIVSNATSSCESFASCMFYVSASSVSILLRKPSLAV